MGERTFIERIIRRSQLAIPERPADFAVERVFLGRLTQDEFCGGLRALHDAMHSLHEDARENFEDYGFYAGQAQELRVNHPVTPNEGKAHKSFRRVADALEAMAVLGALRGDELVVGGDDLREKKIVKLPLVLELLRNNGFSFEGLADNGDLPQGARVHVAFPDNRAVMHVLKAYADVTAVDIGKAILHAEWRVFRESAPFAYDISDMLRGLTGFDRTCVQACDALFLARGYAREVEKSDGVELDYRHKKDRARLVHIKRERDDLRVRLKLAHIADYADALDACSPGVREAVLRGPACGHHGCKGGAIAFAYQGAAHKKCSMLSANFTLPAACGEDISSILLLAGLEIDRRIGKSV